MAGRTHLAIDGGKRCKRDGCRGWAVHDGSGLCAGHSDFVKAKAKAAMELNRKHLGLPRLDSVDACRTWLRLIGEALAEDRLTPVKASELRRIVVNEAARVATVTGPYETKLSEVQATRRTRQRRQGSRPPVDTRAGSPGPRK